MAGPSVPAGPVAGRGDTVGSGQPPDLSRMTPRQAADQLFNRIMTANEQGNMEEARRFVPMALQAYEMVPQLDADAHYHLGLIHAVAGDDDGVRRQIAALRRVSDDHLLAYSLEMGLARKSEDPLEEARIRREFSLAYESEILALRPEYDAHRHAIEELTGGTEVSAAEPPADAGQASFDANCSGCHGASGLGTDQGPPLVYKIYEPGHHGDESFYRAVRQGVRSHHWEFGDMPPVPAVSDQEVAGIIRYIRTLQRAVGIN